MLNLQGTVSPVTVHMKVLSFLRMEQNVHLKLVHRLDGFGLITVNDVDLMGNCGLSERLVREEDLVGLEKNLVIKVCFCLVSEGVELLYKNCLFTVLDLGSEILQSALTRVSFKFDGRL